MSLLAAILVRLWQHGESDELGWPEKLAMLAIAVAIFRVVVRVQEGMVR
jgi:hypothetical protein